MNERKSYKIVNKETGKIVKHLGELQYFRTKLSATKNLEKLRKELKLKLEVQKIW